MKKVSAVCLLFVFTVCTAALYGNDRSQAMSLVKKGIKYIERNGDKKAFDEFSKKDGRFTKGSFYIFVVDFKGITLAHGGNSALVGKNMYDLKDSDGKYFIRNFIELAKSKGKGWVDYKWSNPKTKKIEQKTTYIVRMNKKDYFLGCGIYKK